jgi:hypothetical protein
VRAGAGGLLQEREGGGKKKIVDKDLNLEHSG